MLTSYDYTIASIVDGAGIDGILIGDSAANVMAGHSTTLPITIDQMIYHGALIENLTDLDADVIFIKNIDNVVPDRLKDTTVKYKKLIAGILVSLQKKIFEYLNLIDSGKYTHDEIVEIIQFLQRKLCCRNSETKNMASYFSARSQILSIGATFPSIENTPSVQIIRKRCA